MFYTHVYHIYTACFAYLLIGFVGPAGSPEILELQKDPKMQAIIKDVQTNGWGWMGVGVGSARRDGRDGPRREGEGDVPLLPVL